MKTSLSRLWPPGIRYQLALWYTVVFAILILGAGLIVYKYLERSLDTSLDSTLAQRAEQLAEEVKYKNGHIIIDNSDIQPKSSPVASKTQSLPVDANAAEIVRILDAHGQVLSETAACRQFEVPPESVAQSLQGQPWQGTLKSPRFQEVRIYSVAVTDHGRPFAVVQVGEALAEIHSVLRDVALVLLLLGPIILLLSATGSVWLASRAFAPVHKLTSTARQIKAGDLHQRVPVPAAHDEVRDLALTLNEMIERLEQDFKRQRRFVADASHELRTPVAAIRSKTDLALLQPLTEPEHVAVLQHINMEAERLGHLISDLLALARADEGQSHLEREPVRLDVLVEAVAANAELLAQERAIQLQVQANQPVTILGDEARLIQAVMNLLDNALICTRAGGSIILTVEHDQQVAHILIRDTGEGIAPEHLPHIFERFYRADPARVRREGGSSGLGLSIVDWVIRVHDGSIAVESQPGQGSTFTVTLPLASVKTHEILLNAAIESGSHGI